MSSFFSFIKAMQSSIRTVYAFTLLFHSGFVCCFCLGLTVGCLAWKVWDLEHCCSCTLCSPSPCFPNNFLSSRNYEMKLAKSIVFLNYVKTQPDSRRNEKPSLTVHQPSLKHSGIPQMNISLLKAFFRTMPLTVLISQSLLSAATLANAQPCYYIYTLTLRLIDRFCGQVAGE